MQTICVRLLSYLPPSSRLRSFEAGEPGIPLARPFNGNYEQLPLGAPSPARPIVCNPDTVIQAPQRPAMW
jgi:hypothetical protein